jgi:hypothetical protein
MHVVTHHAEDQHLHTAELLICPENLDELLLFLVPKRELPSSV